MSIQPCSSQCYHAGITDVQTSEKHMWVVSSSMIFILNFGVITLKILVSWLFTCTSALVTCLGTPLEIIFQKSFHTVILLTIFQMNQNETLLCGFLISSTQKTHIWTNYISTVDVPTVPFLYGQKSCFNENSLWKGTLLWWKIHLSHEGFSFLNL